MSERMKEGKRIIKKEEYFARLGQGVPIGDCWVDMGTGELAYALREVVVTSVPINKYNDRTFIMHNVCACVMSADNTRVDTRQRDARIRAAEQQRAFEQKKKITKERLYKVTKEYFSLKKVRSFPNEQLFKSIQGREALLLTGIANDDRPLSVDAFPSDLYVKETQLITEFVQIRSITAKQLKPSKPGEIRPEPTGLEKWHRERSQLDPFAYHAAQQPVIKAVAVGGVVMMSAAGVGALYKAGAFSVKTNLTTAAIKGGTSVIGQAVGGGGAKDINVIGVAGDAFLSPGVGSVVGNAVEWKPFGKTRPFSMVGYNKSFGEFGIEAATSYGLDKVGGYGFNKFSVYLETQGERIFYDIFYSTWQQIISNKTTNSLTQGYESPNNPDN
jgi:hypothetical protein